MKAPIYLIAFSLFIILSGCAMPTTEMALINKNRTYNLCSQENFKTVANKVEERMMQCYTTDTNVTHIAAGFMFTTKTSNNVRKNVKADGSISYAFYTKAALNSEYYGFRVLVEKESSQECRTRVTTHTMNGFWDHNSKRMFEYLKGEIDEC